MLRFGLQQRDVANPVKWSFLHGAIPALPGHALFQLPHLIHDVLPCPGHRGGIADHQISARNLQVYDRLTLRFIPGINETKGFILLLSFQTDLFPRDIVNGVKHPSPSAKQSIPLLHRISILEQSFSAMLAGSGRARPELIRNSAGYFLPLTLSLTLRPDAPPTP